MAKKLKYCLLVICFLLVASIFCGGPKEETLKPNTEVLVTKTTVTIKEPGKDIRIIPVPRSDSITFSLSPQPVLSQPSLWPTLCFLPRIGISTPSNPLVGAQLLRSEPLKIGLALNIGIKGISVSLDRDIWSNIFGGVYYGFSYEGEVKLGAIIGVFL